MTDERLEAIRRDMQGAGCAELIAEVDRLRLANKYAIRGLRRISELAIMVIDRDRLPIERKVELIQAAATSLGWLESMARQTQDIERHTT